MQELFESVCAVDSLRLNDLQSIQLLGPLRLLSTLFHLRERKTKGIIELNKSLFK